MIPTTQRAFSHITSMLTTSVLRLTLLRLSKFHGLLNLAATKRFVTWSSMTASTPAPVFIIISFRLWLHLINTCVNVIHTIGKGKLALFRPLLAVGNQQKFLGRKTLRSKSQFFNQSSAKRSKVLPLYYLMMKPQWGLLWSNSSSSSWAAPLSPSRT